MAVPVLQAPHVAGDVVLVGATLEATALAIDRFETVEDVIRSAAACGGREYIGASGKDSLKKLRFFFSSGRINSAGNADGSEGKFVFTTDKLREMIAGTSESGDDFDTNGTGGEDFEFIVVHGVAEFGTGSCVTFQVSFDTDRDAADGGDEGKEENWEDFHGCVVREICVSPSRGRGVPRTASEETAFSVNRYVPLVVGIPERMFPERESPGGKVPEARLKV